MLHRRALNLCWLVLLLTAAPVQAAEVTGPLRGQVRWSGEVSLRQPVQIESGAVLTIAPGTVVRLLTPEATIAVQGVVKALGSKEAPITFINAPGAQVIEFFEAPAGSEFQHVHFAKALVAIGSYGTPFVLRFCTFRDCQTAVKLLREAKPRIEDCLFVDNDIAVHNDMKSAPLILRNRFQGHRNTAIFAAHNSAGRIEGNTFEKNQQAIGLLQKYQDHLVDNRFIDNVTGIYLNQTQSTPIIKGNTFERNENAMVSFSFSYPVLEQNSFVANRTAVRNDQYGSPLVSNNLFRGNGTALYNYRKSNPKVERNVFEGNELALFCDYSSYPRVRDNHFLGNKMAVQLGLFQSADWEKRSGSKKIIQEAAAARQSQNPLIAQLPTEFNDHVDVRGNWWGEDSKQLSAAGAEGNLPFFYDRRDKARVTYEGFGPDSYALDVVLFSPWLEAPVKGAGPAGGK
jgi:hypothetical protein